MTRLAGVRKEILDFVTSYVRDHGFPPSMREIAKAAHLASVSSAHYHLSKLQAEGYLTKSTAGPRTIRIATSGSELDEAIERVRDAGYLVTKKPPPG